MNGVGNVFGDGSHFNGENAFGDEVARVWSHDAHAEYALGIGIDNELGLAFDAPNGMRFAQSGPGEAHDIDFSVLFAGVGFGQAHPGNFGVGVHDRGDECVKRRGFTGENFGGDFAFVRGFVGKAGTWNGVADCKEAGVVCTHL